MKKLFSLFLCLVLCTALVPAALAEECTCEVHWGSGYLSKENHSDAFGGTMEQAIAAAAADPTSNCYITPLKDLTNAAYTFAVGDYLTVDLDHANVVAAAGKSAFTVTGTASAYFNWQNDFFTGSEACITVNGSDAQATVGNALLLTAADNKPALRLLDGILTYNGCVFTNSSASCDIEYTKGTLEFYSTDNLNGLTIQNKGATLAVDSAAFQTAIQLPEGYYLVEKGATQKAVSFETGKTYTVHGPIIATFYCNYDGSEYGVSTPPNETKTLPTPGTLTLPANPFTHPDPAMKFMGWEYWDEVAGQYITLQPGASFALTNNTYFTAVWDDGITTFTFFPANDDAPYSVDVTGDTYKLPQPVSTDGRTFQGWYCVDPVTYESRIVPAGFLFPATCDMTFDAIWTQSGLYVNDTELKNGEYLSNDGTIHTTKPSGGYAYYANGVLTLHDFKGSLIHAEELSLTIVLEGSSQLESDTSDTLSAFFSNLIIKGKGSLKLVTDEEADDGIYLYESTLDIQGGSITIHADDDGIESTAYVAGNGLLKISGGKLDITTEDDDGIDTIGIAELLITGGEITIHSDDHGIDGSDYALTAIQGGKLNINAGDDGIDSNGGIEITGGEISIVAEDNGIDSNNDSIVISGGRITIFNHDTNGHDNNGIEADKDLNITGGTIKILAGDNGLVAHTGTLSISGGNQNVSVIAPEGLALAGYEALVLQGMKVPEGLTIGKAKDAYGDEYWTLLYNGKSTGSWMGESIAPPSTGDSTPLALLAVLTALSACGMLMLRKRRA